VSFGIGEIVVIVFVLVVVFSASRMGQLGNALGKFVYSFKKASGGNDLVDAGRGSTRLGARGSEPEDAQIVDGEKKP
jgi:sec-independent protein translocase protein TatA